tara:strand:+ start:4927 stop:5370 length:444 start_codon:yes stop_codon:yes gene_type:complete
MENLAQPTEDSWNSRREWFEGLLLEFEESGSYLVSEQASALIGEVQSCYCAGAWVAAIVLAFTVIDAQLIEVEAPGFKGSAKELLESQGLGSECQALRLRRNRIIHLRPEQPAITVDQQWGSRIELKEEAENAIHLMLSAFFANPFV